MSRSRFLSLVSDLSQAAMRRDAARVLAEEIGAEDLLIFSPDPEAGELLPAPGFPQAMPDPVAWERFLASCRPMLPETGRLVHSADGEPKQVVGLAVGHGPVLVVIGGDPQMERANDLVLLLPMLAAAFHVERLALIAEANAATARKSADQARSLADSLEKARSAMRQTLREAEMANQAKDRFLATLSHELRTPLTPVLLLASASEENVELPAKIRADMGVIRRNLELEIQLIDDLLDLSRAMAGKFRLQLEPHDLNQQVMNSVEICRPYLLEQGVTLTLDLQPGLDWISADPARIQQAFWNLLRNAAKFAAKGSVTVRTSAAGAGRVEMAVTDSGIGIDARSLERIFQPFEQGDPTRPRDFGGLGLGLAIAKVVVELHGGRISAASLGPGLGCTFTVNLPSIACPRPPAGLAKESSSDREHRPCGKILVVEDHEDTALVVVRLLERRGHSVKVAHRVETALEMLRLHKFDLLLSDVGLPDGSGHQLMEKASELQPLRGIAMTGYAMDEDVRACFAAGFTEHLTKPVNFRLLEEKITRLLSQQPAPNQTLAAAAKPTAVT